MLVKLPSRQESLVHVSFVLPSSIRAHCIHVVGDFNAWSPVATPMTLSRLDARWSVSVELQAGWCYRFRYLLDGKDWLNDQYADDHVENRHGSLDSVIELGTMFSGSGFTATNPGGWPA